MVQYKQQEHVTFQLFIKSKKGSDFFEPVKRLNLKILGDMIKNVRITTTANQVVQYKQQGNVAFQFFIKSQSPGIKLDVKELLTYPLTPVPHSIGTADGFLVHTDRSKSFYHVTNDLGDADIPLAHETLVIHDGNVADLWC